VVAPVAQPVSAASGAGMPASGIGGQQAAAPQHHHTTRGLEPMDLTGSVEQKVGDAGVAAGDEKDGR